MQDVIIVENSSPQVRYRQGAYLGKGGFAKVYEVTDLESLKSFACKIVK
jgi:serine/threonine protein kinase